MNPRHSHLHPVRGSSILAVMIFVAVMSSALAGVLSYSSFAHRNSTRLGMVERARQVAESEMDYLYFVWKQQALLGTSGDAMLPR